MLAALDGLCAICREAPAAHVDHDHHTGRVRGVLCFNCNGALGQFRDRPDLMVRGARYLTLGSDAFADFLDLGIERSEELSPSERPDGEPNDYLADFLEPEPPDTADRDRAPAPV